MRRVRSTTLTLDKVKAIRSENLAMRPLTLDKVKAIRLAARNGQLAGKAIAKQYDISQPQVSKIVNSKQWR